MFRRAAQGDDGDVGEDAVEILPARGSVRVGDDPWGPGEPDLETPSGSGDDPPDRREWVVGVAVLAVVAVALLALGWGSDGDDGGAAPEVVPTTAPSSTPSTRVISDPVSITPSTTLPPILAGGGTAPFDPRLPRGYVLDPPWEPSVVSASTWTVPSSAAPSRSDLHLWAAPGASRTSGVWVAVEATPVAASFTPPAPSGRRIAIAGTVGVLAVAADGTSTLTFTAPPTGGSPLSITVASFGLTEEQVTSLAASVTSDADGRISMATPEGLRNLVHSRSMPPGSLSAEGLRASPGTSTSTEYSPAPGGPDVGTTDRIDISSFEVSPDFESLVPFLLPHGEQIDVGGRTVWMGRSRADPWSPEHPVAMFAGGRRAVLISGDVDEATLRGAITSVRIASADAWRDLLEETAQRERTTATLPLPQEAIDRRIEEFEVAGDETAPSWSVDLVQHSGGAFFTVWLQGSGSTATVPDSPVVAVVATESLIVAVGFGPPGAGAHRMRLVIEGLAVQEVAGGIYGDAELPVAALAFDELGPYTVELVDAAGAVVATISG